MSHNRKEEQTSKSNIKLREGEMLFEGVEMESPDVWDENLLRERSLREKFIFLGTFRILTTGHFYYLLKKAREFFGHSFDTNC